MATWYRVVAVVSTLLLCGFGTYMAVWQPNIFYRAMGAFLAVFGVLGLLDTFVSRIVLEEDEIHVISLVSKRSYARGDFESAKVDGGAVCLKRRDGGWLILPGTGHNSLSVRNTVHAWIKSAPVERADG